MADPNRMTVAVVDDDREVRVALSRLLRSLGHEVHLFASAEEFVGQTVAVDCLILDVRLPGLSGFELHDRIRRLGSCLPVVFMTGDDGFRVRENTRPPQAPTVLKPFDCDSLLAAIDSAMSLRPA